MARYYLVYEEKGFGTSSVFGRDVYNLISLAKRQSIKEFSVYRDDLCKIENYDQKEFLANWYDEAGNGYWAKRAETEIDLKDKEIKF